MKLLTSTHHDKRGSYIVPDFATDSSVISYWLAREEHQCVGTGVNLLVEGPSVLAYHQPHGKVWDVMHDRGVPGDCVVTDHRTQICLEDMFSHWS